MPKHADDELVEFHYSSHANITFRGTLTREVTWGEWRRMDSAARQETYAEMLNSLVDVWEDED